MALLLELLLARGVDVNCREPALGMTPLVALARRRESDPAVRSRRWSCDFDPTRADAQQIMHTEIKLVEEATQQMVTIEKRDHRPARYSALAKQPQAPLLIASFPPPPLLPSRHSGARRRTWPGCCCSIRIAMSMHAIDWVALPSVVALSSGTSCSLIAASLCSTHR
jgi:hypothetical protein